MENFVVGQNLRFLDDNNKWGFLVLDDCFWFFYKHLYYVAGGLILLLVLLHFSVGGR